LPLPRPYGGRVLALVDVAGVLEIGRGSGCFDATRAVPVVTAQERRVSSKISKERAL